jgi:hypothetical protein
MNQQPIRTPAQCAQEQLEAYNARDIGKFAAVYADDVELIDLASGEVFCRGRHSLVERYGAMFERCVDLHCTLVHRIVCPPFVVDQEHVRGQRDNEIVHAVATYECHDGLIQRAWFFRGSLA